MNQQILIVPPETRTSPGTSCSFLELIQEMKLLGMDPKPVFEIAANDICSLYGAKATIYTELMLDHMIEEDNPDGIYLWKELHHTLSNRISPPNKIIH